MVSDTNVKKKTRMTCIASQQGLEIANKALIERGFDSKLNFAKSQILSRSTVTKFFNFQPIQLDSFKRICEALKLKWREIIEIEEKQEVLFLSTIENFPELNINHQDAVVQTLTRQLIVKNPQNNEVIAVVILKGDINSDQNLEIMQFTLREYSGNTIEIIDIQEGSIKLIIEGSQEDIEKLIYCIKSGKLTELNGFPIEDIKILSETLDEEENNELNNKWDLVREIVTQGAKGKNLKNADLSDADLSDADLSDADLSDADLSNADLSNADLTIADLSNANLSYADLSSADLHRAYLSSANLSYADLHSADLSNANLSSANLSSANLSNANLNYAHLISANLSSTDLSYADLSSADLISADLRSTDLSSANLSYADLRSADLSDAKVENTIFGNNIGISLEQRYELIERGAIFNDFPGDRSGMLTPH